MTRTDPSNFHVVCLETNDTGQPELLTYILLYKTIGSEVASIRSSAPLSSFATSVAEGRASMVRPQEQGTLAIQVLSLLCSPAATCQSKRESEHWFLLWKALRNLNHDSRTLDGHLLSRSAGTPCQKEPVSLRRDRIGRSVWLLLVRCTIKIRWDWQIGLFAAPRRYITCL